MPNIFDLLGDKIFPKPSQIPVDSVKKAAWSEQEFKSLKSFGVTSDALNRFLSENLILNTDRTTVYRQLESALTHPLISSAIDLYADTAVQRSVINDKIIWVDSENKEYKYQIEKLFDVINIEEVIYDWSWTTGFYGDHFVQVHGEPGVGIVSVEDDLHPLYVSRADYQGRLIGYFMTPQGATNTSRELIPPYHFVHFRLLGAKKRRPIFGDVNYTEFRSISLMAPDIRRVNSKYGVSLANNALPIYRRLRLVEDSILMSRITKGVTRYLYSVGVGENSTPEAVAALIDNYVDVLKSARNMSIDTDNPSFSSKASPLSSLEDIILPVWGDVNNLKIDKLGGETFDNVKWIADADELRNQLFCALKTPGHMLGGYQSEVQGPLGGSAAERIDIRFARQCRKLQTTIKSGLTRLAQIHLAYQGLNPDLNMFEIKMADISTIEELEAQKSLGEAADTVDRVTELIFKHTGQRIDKLELLDYFNKKLLKLEDLDLRKMIKAAKDLGPHKSVTPEEISNEVPTDENPFREAKEEDAYVGISKIYENSDLKAELPLDLEEGRRCNKLWESKYKGVMVNIEENKTT